MVKIFKFLQFHLWTSKRIFFFTRYATSSPLYFRGTRTRDVTIPYEPSRQTGEDTPHDLIMIERNISSEEGVACLFLVEK